jgi:hypothetical protein
MKIYEEELRVEDQEDYWLDYNLYKLVESMMLCLYEHDHVMLNFHPG